ncbi:hypothetical protein [Staphylococcus warneri]|uniref:Uncharacterized protein n=1 Tax=Staphylococcus warneri TaxID=1292 RepID=A0A2T4Q149_STAWA|nr:hypothetical protein [Staphylococcus warneri]PTI51391.1 hypothetical protein BU085_05215 [Staphylococcus warneri]RIN12737.1 hypothetical protein BU086_07020 [Staphylococcus warneri]
MKWSRCPRCNSGMVVEVKSGCGGCLSRLILIAFVFPALAIFGYFMEGGFSEIPLFIIPLVIFAISLPTLFIFLNAKFGRELFCKSCHLHFRAK